MIVITASFFRESLTFLSSYLLSHRNADDVLNDLKQEAASELKHAGLPKRFALWLACLCLFAGAVTGCQSFISLSPQSLAGLCIVCLSVYVLGSGAYRRRLIQHHRWQIDYYLPMIMERLVMAVEAGLDLVPAFHAVVEIERQESDTMDPVSMLLADVCRYVESGIGFPEALALVESQAGGFGLKHAFVHLTLAYREGGEIIYPLRELSDASQIQYQEIVEEEIAKLPVRATLPLLCTFAGLIVSFLTAPLIQVLTITQQAHPG